MAAKPKAKSQWDFGGELFPAEELRKVFSVTEITGTVRRLLEQQVGTVWVTGEVSNLRAQSSGHIYFSLKDAGAQLSCVCFRESARGSRQLLQDGRKVILHGNVTVYEARGQYQLLVTEVELEGLGALQLAFEKLKARLAAEGLFAPERKRPLPECIQRLGLVTSPSTAALRDILHVVGRRNPGLDIILAPCRVQGQGAAEEIAGAVRQLNALARTGVRLDAILVTRGGGSLEDLWAFNEEVVARAIFESAIPVVSGVGHEIDFTISDFVADLRAATPSAAAEILTEGMLRRRLWITEATQRLFTLAQERLQAEQERFGWLTGRLGRTHPRRHLQEQAQRLDDLQLSLQRGTRKEWRRHQVALHQLSQRLLRVKASRRLAESQADWRQLLRRFHEAARRGLTWHQQRWQRAETSLRLLSPQQTLERGFSITEDEATGKILRDATEVQPGQSLRTRLAQGEIRSVAKGGNKS